MSVLILQAHGLGYVSGPGDAWVKIAITVHGTLSYLYLDATNGIAGPQYFKTSDDDISQAHNFASSFNRDYSNVGGFANLKAEVSIDQIIITAKAGTFGIYEQFGGYITFVSVDNTATVPPVNLNVSITVSGDCENINYTAVGSGGSGTYTLRNGTTIILSGWNGSSYNMGLPRGTVNNITLTDGGGRTVSRTINVPRKLKPGEFKERITQFEDYSDIEIESVNPVSGTTPLEYAITDLGEITGSDYRSSSSFPGIFPGEYLLWIKDVYGCEVSKTIIVSEFQDATITEDPKYFLIPEANSLVFTEKTDFVGEKRRNYFNTRSYIEKATGKAYRIEQCFFREHTVPTRFKSSFPFHIVTLRKCDGTKQDIPVIMVQENLGSTEKLDCKLFNAPGGQIGVYFDGGNEYEPNTETIIGSSPYSGFTPEWNVVGQLVFVGGVGAKYITGSGYDENRGYYFAVDGVTVDDLDSMVQVTYNKQLYNVFDFFVFMSDIPLSGIIEIQYGYGFDAIAGTYISELIKKVDDTEDWHLVKWGSDKNMGDMIFQSFPQPFVLLKGKLDNIWPTTVETSRGDDKEYSLDQETFLGFIFRTGRLTRKMVTKLSIASGTPFFEINGVMLTRNAEPTVDPYGQTNLKTWQCEFGYGGNLLGIKDDELVLDVSTGVIGGGTGKPGAPIPDLGSVEYDGKTRYKDSSGNLFTIGGKTITV